MRRGTILFLILLAALLCGGAPEGMAISPQLQVFATARSGDASAAAAVGLEGEWGENLASGGSGAVLSMVELGNLLVPPWKRSTTDQWIREMEAGRAEAFAGESGSSQVAYYAGSVLGMFGGPEVAAKAAGGIAETLAGTGKLSEDLGGGVEELAGGMGRTYRFDNLGVARLPMSEDLSAAEATRVEAAWEQAGTGATEVQEEAEELGNTVGGTATSSQRAEAELGTAQTGAAKATIGEAGGTTAETAGTGAAEGGAPLIRESRGAHTLQYGGVSATAKTSRSAITAIRADIAESSTYNEALSRGEIGIQAPGGANVPGADFITVGQDATGKLVVYVNDAKSSIRGVFPTPRTQLPASWLAEVRSAVAPGRLDLENPALEAEIRDTVQNGRVSQRQINVNYAPLPTGKGSVTGF
jgi:hypothetical protein